MGEGQTTLKHLVWIAFLFIALSLPLTGSHTRVLASPDNSIVRGFRATQLELYNSVAKSGYIKAIPRYRQAAADAERLGYPRFSISFLNNLGACQLATFQFRDALKTLLATRVLAEKMHDQKVLSGLGTNISAVFMLMGNLEESAEAAERGVAYRHSVAPEFSSRSLTQLGRVRTELKQFKEADTLFHEAIEDALRANIQGNRHLADTDSAAWAWDALGYAKQKQGKWQEAEYAATQGLRLRKLSPTSATESSYMILGLARAAQGDFTSGIALLDAAERALHEPGSRTAPWRIYEARGRIKLQAGMLEPALKDLRTAISLARAWRIDVIPNDANRIGTEELLAQLYGSVIEAGNRLYQQNHDAALVRETFEASEENRVASLRAMRSQRDDWRGRLTPDYSVTLAQLLASEAQWLREGQTEPTAEVRLLRSKLAQMEADAGAPALRDHSLALDRTRRNLDDDSTLFSFQLGVENSWLWAVTSKTITVHRLPGKAALGLQIHRFEVAAQTDSKTVKAEGSDLYASLLGSVERSALQHKRWLLALDGPLFNLPFPALSSADGEALIVNHSFQIATGALMLQDTGSLGTFQGSFLGVGDPVYNAADPRARADKYAGVTWPSLSTAGLSMMGSNEAPLFARLWGTGNEIEASAKAWSAPKSIILKGIDATALQFWKATEANPSVIHLATHILERNSRLGTGWIALSLNSEGDLDFLTPEQISSHAVAAKLVVLSGCSSGKADTRASGLMGLTRAWIAAGAGAVLATRWPTVDDDGAFFESFYKSLRLNPRAGPAEALRAASLEMVKSATWRSRSSFWGGYFLVGNY